jgi:hypothetical protein
MKDRSGKENLRGLDFLEKYAKLSQENSNFRLKQIKIERRLLWPTADILGLSTQKAILGRTDLSAYI